jgi:hypothetical protein
MSGIKPGLSSPEPLTIGSRYPGSRELGNSCIGRKMKKVGGRHECKEQEFARKPECGRYV